MTREEEIKEALSKYVKDRGVVGNYIVDVERDAAFIAGAMWADRSPKNIWHDASEMPQKRRDILLIDKLHNSWVCVFDSRLDKPDGWKQYVKSELVIMWAYVDELLPKGGEK